MARFHYTILSRAVAGREEEFVTWYRDQHMADVCHMPGVVSGRLYRMDFQRVYNLDDAPQWTLMTIYELEGEDPEPIINHIRDTSGSAVMPACEALDKAGMIQAAGHLIASGEGTAGLADGAVRIPARDVPIPAFLSDIAKAYLVPQGGSIPYPPIDDMEGWRAYVAAVDQNVLPLLRRMGTQVQADVTERDADGARVYEIVPPGLPEDDRGVVLEIHGGALILCGGELCRIMGTASALRLQRRIWSVDYRMPPDHPYPTPLDDCLAAYRALLREREPHEIIISGGSAGGNLAAALILRARDEGLPLPAGAILATPEADLTESGDSFNTNNGVDPGLRSLMPVNLLYANGHDLAHPYLSPLFGDFTKGFPRTLLTTGTRDLYLSNTVRMHRALRAADIQAELHVTEAGPHTGFPGGPEGAEIDRELRRFITEALNAG
jgi:acetyl esterase/lipase